MSKKIRPSPIEILRGLLEPGKQFLVCTRSNGYIVPSSVKVTTFEESIKLLKVSVWPRWRVGMGFSVRGGIYEITQSGETQNIHSKLRRCWDAGLIGVVDDRITLQVALLN